VLNEIKQIVILNLTCIVRSYFNVMSTIHFIAMKAQSKMFIDPERTTLY